MGSLTYEPAITWSRLPETWDLDRLAAEAARILNTDYSEDLDELFALGGSSGGARPKILTRVDDEDWIIKFPAAVDKPDVGEMEFHYALTARECGIEIPEVRLFTSKAHAGYFGVKRFDRINDKGGHPQRVHTVSASGLLETSHRLPSLDYEVLFRLCVRITGSYDELEKLYRLACFNVFAHNQDDHSKNFSFIFDFATGTWRLSPAYALTSSVGMGGEHATTVNGKGRDITTDDLVALADKFRFPKAASRAIASEVHEKTQALLRWMG
jgi:serine/threonine-protein kinase HipA